MTQAQRTIQGTSGIWTATLVAVGLAAFLVTAAITFQLVRPAQVGFDSATTGVTATEAQAASGEQWVHERMQQSVGTITSPAVIEAGDAWERQQQQQIPGAPYLDLTPTAPELR